MEIYSVLRWKWIYGGLLLNFLFLLLNPVSVFAQTLTYSQNGKWGLCSKEGRVIYAPSFQFIQSVDAKYFKVYHQKKEGLIDSSGKVILPAAYEGVMVFEKSFAVKNKKWALVDSLGKPLTDFEYESIHEIRKNLILLNNSTRQKLLNAATMAVSDSYDRVYYSGKSFTEKYSQPAIRFITGEEKGALYESTLKEAVRTNECDDAWTSGAFGIAKKKNGHLEVFVNGTKIELQEERTLVMLLSQQYLVVGHPGKSYLLMSARTGKVYLPHPECINYKFISDSVIVFQVKERFGLMNGNGEVIYPAEFDAPPLLRSDKLLYFSKNDRFGIMDQDLKIVIPPMYTFIAEFSEGIAVAANADSLEGAITLSHDTILDFQFTIVKQSRAALKAYRNGGMLLCKLDEVNRRITDSTFYENVKTLEIRERKNNTGTNMTVIRGTSTVPEPNVVKDYVLLFKKVKSKARQRSYIPGASDRAVWLYGLFYNPQKRKVLAEEHWHVRMADFEKGQCVRVVLKDGKVGLYLTETNKLQKRIYCEVKGKMGMYEISYMGPFENNLARINLTGVLQKGNDIEDIGPYAGAEYQVTGGRWGYIDTHGKIRGKITYDYASDFHHGQAIVAVKGKYGIIDTMFHWVVKPTYERLSFLKGSDFRQYLITRNKKELGIIDLEGRLVIQGAFQKIATPYDDWIAVQNNTWGFCDLEGTIRIEPQFLMAQSFREGFAAVKIKSGWGYIDKSGTMVIEAQYQRATPFYNGVAGVMKGNKWSLIDKQGNQIRKLELDMVVEFYRGKIIVKKNKQWGLLNSEGKWEINPGHGKIIFLKPTSLVAVYSKKGWKIFTLEGKATERKHYDQIKSFEENFCLVKQRERWGYIDTLGELKIPTKYKEASAFSEYRAKVRVNGKFGFIDTLGKLVIAPQYHSALSFYDGKALVVPLKGSCQYIDPQGKLLYVSEHHFSIPSGQLRGKYFVFEDRVVNIKRELVHQHVSRGSAVGPNLYRLYRNQKLTGILRQPVLVCQRDMSVLQEVKDISLPDQGLIRYTSTQQFGLLNFKGEEIVKPINGKIVFENGLIKVSNWADVEYLKSSGERLINR